jgi:hypothetical protein
MLSNSNIPINSNQGKFHAEDPDAGRSSAGQYAQA